MKNANGKGFDKNRRQSSSSQFKCQDKEKKDVKDSSQYTVLARLGVYYDVIVSKPFFFFFNFYITSTMNRNSCKPLYYVKKKKIVTMRLPSMRFQHFYKLFFRHTCIHTKNYATNRFVLTLIFIEKGYQDIVFENCNSLL